MNDITIRFPTEQLDRWSGTVEPCTVSYTISASDARSLMNDIAGKLEDLEKAAASEAMELDASERAEFARLSEKYAHSREKADAK